VSFVLDASVALAWCFKDERRSSDMAILEALKSSEAIVPMLWTLETSNGLLLAERRGRVDAAEVDGLIRMLLSLPISIDPGSKSDAFLTVRRLARAHGLTSYDAAYLDVALRHAFPVATRDARLGAAAEKEGVGRFEPA
jgi:predicted nucleic acid-binding protein